MVLVHRHREEQGDQGIRPGRQGQYGADARRRAVERAGAVVARRDDGAAVDLHRGVELRRGCDLSEASEEDARGRDFDFVRAIHAFTDASEANRMLQRYLPPIVKSAETRQKISVAQTGSNNNFYGATHAPETLKVLSEHRKGIKWINDGQKEKQIPKMDSIPYGWKAGRLKRK